MTHTAETENKEAPSTPVEYDNNNSIKAFNFRELASATKNFRQECLLGEGGLGKVYKGTIQGTGQVLSLRVYFIISYHVRICVGYMHT